MRKKIDYRYGILFACMLLAGVSAVYVQSCSGRKLNLAAQATEKLRVGVVQMDISTSIEENRDFIIDCIQKVGKQRGRVVVFPERALSGTGGDDTVRVNKAVVAIQQAAAESNVYAIVGGFSFLSSIEKPGNWMAVFSPDGERLFYYEKIYNNRRGEMPGVFYIDGVPCSAIICADRWLRGVEEIPIQQGAKISFELSNNFGEEWVESLQWYWYVPRALRNNVWVVLSNSGKRNYTWPYTPKDTNGHGHSAIISPEGKFAARAEDNKARILIADIDLTAATRAEALARSSHPVLAEFWEAGMRLQRGEKVDSVGYNPLQSRPGDITMAVAQVTGDLSRMVNLVGMAKARHADVVVFPERAISGPSALTVLQNAARANTITVVVGMEHQLADGLRNSAFVIGPEGDIITRYDQLSAEGKYIPGMDPSRMWFHVRGVPAVVTIGRDVRWTELSELAAVAGAQIHVHLDHGLIDDNEEHLMRLQLWSNMATFRTFTAVANVNASTIWEDLNTRSEVRSVIDGKPRPETGSIEIFSPWSANLIVEANADELIVATRRMSSKTNTFHPRSTSNFNPQMQNWYHIGAKIIRSGVGKRAGELWAD